MFMRDQGQRCLRWIKQLRFSDQTGRPDGYCWTNSTAAIATENSTAATAL